MVPFEGMVCMPEISDPLGQGIDSIILFLQALQILIHRAIVATQEDKSLTSDTHMEEQGIQLTLSPILS